MSVTLIRRIFFFGLLMPCLYIGTASATYLIRIRNENGARLHVHFPAYAAPTSASRIIVFSPHCDDETLGCGGLIQKAKHAGAHVKIVTLTNGDGFRVAVETHLRSVQVRPDDYVRFAEFRQNESYRALGILGLPKEDVVFLGYPDRGLLSMWNENWSPSHPYRSLYTGQIRSPYGNAYHQGAVYCGQSLLDDLKGLLEQEEPTDVYVTHPSDDHPDHSAASSFVALALRELSARNLPWARSCRMHYYLVHRGDWPVPQGFDKREPLVPPGEMAGLDTEWRSLPLEPAEVDRKAKAILAYASQTAVMKRFLVSFARTSEVFGDMPDERIPLVPSGTIRVDGDTSEWRGLKPVLLDPINDNLIRDFQAGGDVKAVYACRDSSNLYLRVDTCQPVTNRLEFRVRVRYFGDENHGRAGGLDTLSVRPPATVSPAGPVGAVRGNRVEVAIPLRDLNHSPDLALSVESAVAGIQVDRTGYRFLDF